MNSSFLNDVLQQLLREGINLSKTIFVLPSKRAGSFLKELLKTQTDYSGFAPDIISIEEFIGEITGLESIDNTNSIFRFYETYKKLTPKEDREDFETFYGWAQTLMYDFNEIDRYLIDSEKFYSYLSDIQEINHWALADPQTELVSNYLKFWRRLPTYHTTFVEVLLGKNQAYQGLIYRQASVEIETYLNRCSRQIVFIGFNALNNVEQKIIQTVLENNRGRIFWDIDRYFMEDTQHGAGLFIRHYQSNWPYFKGHPLEGISDHYSAKKKIEVIGISKNIGQVKTVGQILKKEKLENTAVVLNDEGLLLPLLNSLPNKVKKANITMGLTLNMTPPASFFEILFKIQKNTSGALYYKNVLDLLSHPTLKLVFGTASRAIQEYMINGNRTFIGVHKLTELVEGEKEKEIITLSCSHYQNDTDQFLQALLRLIPLLRPQNVQKYPLETEYLFHFNQVFKKLYNLLNEFGSISQIVTLHRLYKDVLQGESIDFEGSPFQGLQIMGMLETRVLNYDTVILTSVNEGILPSGKSTNSFIPFDLKKQYKLPTYREKDAVYTYHFYRLLQRAKKVYILYNTERSGLNAGEKSRFITQLEVERPQSFDFKTSLKTGFIAKNDVERKEIEKSPEILEILKRQAEKGFSPSALTTYIRNPIAFYKNYVLGIRDPELIEETIAVNTLGTVVHSALENFYRPLEGQELSETDIRSMLKKIENETEQQFRENYSEIPLESGKNLIIKEVAKRFIFNFLQRELKAVKQGNTPKIIRIENGALKEKIDLPKLDFPVYLRGIVDRVDEINGQLRIVDYKTGMVKAEELVLRDWQKLISDKKYDKAFQVLAYTSMILSKNDRNAAQAGIFSFRNLGKDFMKFQFKPEKKEIIDKEILNAFHDAVKILILEIFNPEIPFMEPEED